MKFSQFYEAHEFLQGHPMFIDTFSNALDIMVVKVNPETKAIDDDDSKNTLVQVWLETGPYAYVEEAGGYMGTHDHNLDVGGSTFEEALIELANLVRERYGEYTAEDQKAAYKTWHNTLLQKHS